MRRAPARDLLLVHVLAQPGVGLHETAGALVGALVPETEQERQVLGDASRQVASTVRDTVDEAGRQAEQAVDEAERSMAPTGGVGA